MQVAEEKSTSWNETLSGLSRGDRQAVDRMRELLRGHVTTLAQKVWQRSRIKGDANQFAERFLSLAIMWLRTRHDLEESSTPELLISRVLFFLAKQFLRPERGDIPPSPQPAMPQHPRFEIETLIKPLDEVSGDWCAGDVTQDGALWLLIADVTGHGWPAHVLTSGLPHLWNLDAVRQWRERGESPASVLEYLSQELRSTPLPDGLFVDATLARFDADGDVVIAAAGECRSLWHQPHEQRVEFQRFGSSYLGVDFAHDPPAERRWPLRPADEWLLSSDGLFDQPHHTGRLGETLAKMKSLPQPHRSLCAAVAELLDRALATRPQHDDITKVVVRLCSS